MKTLQKSLDWGLQSQRYILQYKKKSAEYRLRVRKLCLKINEHIADYLCTGCPKPNFKSHNIIMSARVYFKKRVKDC